MTIEIKYANFDSCFVGPKFEPEYDAILFEETDVLIPIEERDTTLAHLMFKAGKFKSVSDAKRNGWDKPIPLGWSEFRVASKSKNPNVFIWNPQWTHDEWQEQYGELYADD